MIASTVIEFTVAGIPAGQPRARHRIVNPRRGGQFVQIYTPDTAEGWKNAVWLAARGKVQAQILEPLHVHINVYFPRPQRLQTKKAPAGAVPHAAKPDKDNVEKAILDAMKDAGVYRDDAQVCGGGTWKWYVAKGAPPGARIRLEILRTDPQLSLAPSGPAASPPIHHAKRPR